MSFVQAHINNHDYQVNDRILCYFAFPRIETAVALWPGDVLLFNPQELHSISSRCKSGDKIFCISSYLKNSLTPKSVPAGTKLVLFGRYILNFYVGIV
jgi:hypothetical protein